MNGFNQLKLLNGFPHFHVTKKERKKNKTTPSAFHVWGDIFAKISSIFPVFEFILSSTSSVFCINHQNSTWRYRQLIGLRESQVWQILSTEINRDDKLPWGKHLMSSQSRDISAYVSPRFSPPTSPHSLVAIMLEIDIFSCINNQG